MPGESRVLSHGPAACGWHASCCAVGMKHRNEHWVVLGLLLGASPAAALDAVPTEPERLWQASVQGRWHPGLGEAKGSVAEEPGPGAEGGWGLRLERRFHDLWSLGLGLSRSAWSATGSGEAGVLESGSFVDAALVLKLEPLSIDIPGGPLALYLTASGGPTLAGDTVFVRAPSASGDEGFESVRFDAGYNAGASVGASYRPFEALSVSLEGGLDWHYAVHARRSVDLDALGAGAPLPPAYVERLWVGQAVVALGMAFHF